MLRLILVLGFAFVGSQFPAYYQSYIVQVDDDLRSALTSGAPEALIATLKQQRTDLLYADPAGWPMAFAGAWDADRAVATLAESWSPRMPEDGVDWAYGVAGLFAGYFVTAILFALFRGRPATPIQAPAARTSARTFAPAQSSAPARKIQRPDKPRAVAPAADHVSPWAPRPEGPPDPRQVPASSSNLSGGSVFQAAARLARETAREAAQDARDLVRQQAGQADAEERRTNVGPRTGQNAVETRFRSTHVIEFSRPRPLDAITMSYERPPLIVRRKVMRDLGPIERVTIFRD